jgi:hypothetical protein
MIYLVYLQSFGMNNLYIRGYHTELKNVWSFSGNNDFLEDCNNKPFGYKISNVNLIFLPKTVRHAIRFIEGFIGHLLLIGYLIFKKRGAIYWSLFYFIWYEKLAIKILSKLGFEIITVIHDYDEKMLKEVSGNSFLKNSISKIDKFLLKKSLAVHNKKLKHKLQKKGYNVRYTPFPLMKFDLPFKKNKIKSIDFLFIGTYRKDKNFEAAIDKLLNNKQDVNIQCCSYDLPKGFINKYSSKITVKSGYLTVDEFKIVVSNSKFVIFPYDGGNSSGLPLLVSSLGATPVLSESPAFSEYRSFMKDELYYENNEWINNEIDFNCDLFLTKYKNHFNDEWSN